MSTNAWNLRGSSTNEYIVEARILKDIHYRSEYAMLWGKLNEGREVKVTKIERGDSKASISSGGNDSIVWEQDFGTDTAEARFSYEDPMTGTRTFGTADVEAGSFPQFRHDVVYAVQNDSPAVPLLDKESQMRQTKIIPFGQLLPRTKKKATLWRSKMTEIDGFSALLNGASDGLLMTTKGGMGITLPGCSAGETRPPYNTFVVGEDGLTTPNYTRATHVGTLGTLLAALTDVAANGFDFEQHKILSYLISALRFKDVTLGNGTYRAICIADPRNMSRLADVAGNWSKLRTYATPRAEKNPALDGMQTIELDNILYISNMYLEYFRPTADATTVTHMTPGTDPFASSFSNSSNICPMIYLGAGAMLRGKRKEVWFTISGEGASDAGHKKGTTVALHYYDAWKRKGWVTQDGTSSILDDSCLVAYFYDPGVGIAYAA